MRVELLADHLDALPQLAELFMAEWAPYYGPNGPGNALADLKSRCRRDTIPIGLVAIDAFEILGTVAIDRDPTTQLEPSIVGLLVLPDRRGEGVATALLQAAATLAKTIGYPRIHTSTALPYMWDALQSKGWRRTGEVEYLNGEHGQVFELEL